MTRLGRGPVVIVLVVLFAIGAQSASAAIVLDRSFGGDGKVTTSIGPRGYESVALALARQPDGKLVAAGVFNEDRFALVRYNANGRLDPSFGSGGGVVTDITPFDTASDVGTDQANAVAIQPDGKIVAAGFAGAFPSSDGNNGNFALVRYNRDGSLDTGFGAGGKVVTTVGDFGGPAYALALQSDGKIVAAGQASGSDGGQEFAVARFNRNGTVDGSFGAGGAVLTDVRGQDGEDAVRAVAIQRDGKIVAAGDSYEAGGGFTSDFAVVRYNPNGTLDPSFGGDGRVTTPISTQSDFNSDEANALVIQPDGKLVAAGSTLGRSGTLDKFALVRYRPNGGLDSGFGSGGKVITTVKPDEGAVVNGLALQSDGKLVASGWVTDIANETLDFATARYRADGSLDARFHGDGRITTSLAPAHGVDAARAVAIQPDGRIVAAGYADMDGSADHADYDFALVRYVRVADHTPPNTTIKKHPKKTTTKRRASFAFRSSEEASTFRCRLDSGSWRRCSSPKSYKHLRARKHTFRVRAVDQDGNVDPTPARFAWRVKP